MRFLELNKNKYGDWGLGVGVGGRGFGEWGLRSRAQAKFQNP